MNLSKEALEQELYIAPLAIPLSPSLLDEKGIKLDSLPVAKSISEAKNFQICEASNQTKREESTIQAKTDSNAYVNKDAGDFKVDRSPPVALKGFTQNRKVATSKKTDEGIVDPKSFLTVLAAFITVLLFLSAFIGVLGVVLLIINRDQKLYLIGPGITLLMAILYLLFPFQKRCCVCHQKQFVKAQNRKKANSHYIPLLGYIIPTSFRILVRRNFYCMICNSKLRIFK